MLEMFYRSLYRIRKVEEEIARVYPSDQIKSPIHLSIGQEAISVGVCEALEKSDVVFGTYRSHALYLAKGGDLKKMIAELYGKAGGCSKGKGGSMHLADREAGVMGTSAIVATAIPHAVGYAYGFKYQKKSDIAVCFFGDGATEEGVFYESLNFAALKELSVLFICENNRYAVHSRQEARQSRSQITEKVKSFGIPSVQSDGADIFSVYDLAKKKCAEIREHQTPQFLEFSCYRLREHVGPDEDFEKGYRSQSEAEPWVTNDPLKMISQKLPAEVRQRIEAEVGSEIQEAFRYAEESPLPESDQLFGDLYESPLSDVHD